DINRQASASPFFLQSLQLTENKAKEVVLIGKRNDDFIDKIHKEFLPNTVFLVAESPEDFTEIAPFASNYKQIDESLTVYICENFSCKQPTTNLEEAYKMIVEK